MSEPSRATPEALAGLEAELARTVAKNDELRASVDVTRRAARALTLVDRATQGISTHWRALAAGALGGWLATNATEQLVSDPSWGHALVVLAILGWVAWAWARRYKRGPYAELAQSVAALEAAERARLRVESPPAVAPETETVEVAADDADDASRLRVGR